MGFTTVQEVCEAIRKNITPLVIPQRSEEYWTEITREFETY